MSHLPLTIDMEGKQAVIVGGGPVAEKRADALIDAGASVVVVSPGVTFSLQKWAEKGLLQWESKEFEACDVKGAFLVVAATGVREVDEKVKESGKEVPLVSIAGEAEAGNVQFPAHVSRGRLSIAVSTGGASPALSSRIKRRLEEEYDEDYVPYLNFLHHCRQEIKRSGLSAAKKKEVLEGLLDQTYQKEEEQERMVAWLEEIR